MVDGRYRIVSQPPIVVPLRDLAPSIGRSVERARAAHPRPVPRLPQRRCRMIGASCSSGSRWSTWPARSWASAASARGRSSCCSRVAIEQDPLFLQVKEATASVLEDHLPKSRYQPARRTSGAGPADDAGRERHLPGLDEGRRGRPLPVLAAAPRHEGLGRRRDDGPRRSSTFYAGVCGRTLARAHARSGDPVALAAYLGKKDRFDQSITDFAERYADQNEQDYQAFAERHPVRPARGGRGRLIRRPAESG